MSSPTIVNLVKSAIKDDNVSLLTAFALNSIEESLLMIRQYQGIENLNSEEILVLFKNANAGRSSFETLTLLYSEIGGDEMLKKALTDLLKNRNNNEL